VRITLFAHGLRGDVWPIVALGWKLAERDHDVTIALPGEFRAFGERAGLRTATLPLNLMSWLGTTEGQRLLNRGGVRVMRGIASQYSRHADALDEAHRAAAAGAEALVGALLTVDRAQVLGDLLEIPVAMVFQQPVAPSGELSSVVLTKGHVRSRWLRRASGDLAYRIWWRGNAKATFAFRRKLGLPARSRPTYHRMRDHGTLGLHTFSPSLLPRPTDWPDNFVVTGAWGMPTALRKSIDEGLPDDLQAWLDAGDAPIFLGFGSMPVLEPERMLDDIAGVTSALGRRAIVSENCIPREIAVRLPDHLRAVGVLDHDRLFPRCAAVVHHGGLGSTTASLRAGRPTMVCSVFGDQPWWGEQMQRLGVGVHLPFRKLDRDTLEAGLRTLLDPAVARRAGALGSAIQSEGDGLPEAAQLLEDWLVAAEPAP
jgi:sterol 3beta-glucosyltransferase